MALEAKDLVKIHVKKDFQPLKFYYFMALGFNAERFCHFANIYYASRKLPK